MKGNGKDVKKTPSLQPWCFLPSFPCCLSVHFPSFLSLLKTFELLSLRRCAQRACLAERELVVVR
ncbi:hypothetical protein GmHk_14G041955 [Glycine max]|nr:hypothetical protein GmHk_14G041955 [Glycine max]